MELRQVGEAGSEPELCEAARKERLRTWLDSDPELRDWFIQMDDWLKALDARVKKWERLAIGMRERLPNG